MTGRAAALVLAASLAASPALGEEGTEGKGKAPTPAELLRRADEAIYVFSESGAKALEGTLVIPGTALGTLRVDFAWKAPAREGEAETLKVTAAEGVPEAYHPLAEKQATGALESLVIGRPLARLAGEARLSVEMKDGEPLLRVAYAAGNLRGTKATFTFDPGTGTPKTQVLESPTGATITDVFRYGKHGRTHRLESFERRTRDPSGKEHVGETVIEWVATGEIALPWRIRSRGQLLGAADVHLEGIVIDGTRVVTPGEVAEREKEAGDGK